MDSKTFRTDDEECWSSIIKFIKKEIDHAPDMRQCAQLIYQILNLEVKFGEILHIDIRI